MTRRSTKQQRTYGGRRYEPARPRISTAPQTFRGEISVRRDLWASDAQQMDKVLMNIPRRSTAYRHVGKWAVFVLGPEEYKEPASRSPLRGYRDMDYLVQELSAALADVSAPGVQARVTNLVQRGKWIGPEVVYDTYAKEREMVVGALGRILSVRHQWREETPFIPMAVASLEDITNRRQLNAALPSVINLHPWRQVPAPVQ